MSDSAIPYQGQLALITGGSSGIGLAVARMLAKAGASVWLLARHADTLGAACRGLDTSSGQKHGYITADVADWGEVEAALERLQREVGIPNLLVNSAGVTEPGFADELSVEIYRQMMEINYMGTVHVTKALLPGMLKRGNGDIVNISSAAGFVTGPGYAAYSPSKFAVRGFSDALRAEVKPRGLRVFLVYPPNTETPQRAYEVSHQSPEIHYVDEHAGLGPWKFGTLPVDQVASDILKGMQKGKYVILPGSGNAVLYHLIRLLGGLVYSITDDEWATARKHSKT